MHKLLLVSVWPIATATTLIANIFLFSFIAPSQGHVKGTSTTQPIEFRTNYQLFTAIPSYRNSVEENITIKDARVEIIHQFLARYKSPLEPHADLLVSVADKHNLDFRLLPAVAMQESILCKIIPEDSHNCWGYGIYGDNVLRFDSYEEAIEKVAKGISNNYVYAGLTTPEQIMSRYTPSSDGSWAQAVRHFMEQME